LNRKNVGNSLRAGGKLINRYERDEVRKFFYLAIQLAEAFFIKSGRKLAGDCQLTHYQTGHGSLLNIARCGQRILMVLDEKNDAEHKLIILRPILVDITALTEAE
jgi:hypothetical protein